MIEQPPLTIPPLADTLVPADHADLQMALSEQHRAQAANNEALTALKRAQARAQETGARAHVAAGYYGHTYQRLAVAYALQPNDQLNYQTGVITRRAGGGQGDEAR